ncbi:hypothetical protein SMD11_1601 [Streptomyces albireticuli]|uniref:DUF1772 domain-containing protein n=1 Tax=Streptomyces albireticuli TaxID=1940 RepID=A0A1Z2KYY9_9ACTN|nr:DUF1772 domain-containing protein [Streptomyces albireticuli]ARZ67262.1 hypothetical protein SMD11_1601 [Streptomyces albireticuli]
MTTVAFQAPAVLAVLSNAVIYGTDVFSALVQRPALAQVDDRTLTEMMGQVHRYGDKRLPAPGTVGLIAAIAGTVIAAAQGETVSAVAGGVACVALLAWLGFFNKVVAPANRALTRAADTGGTATDVRALQRRSDGVLGALICCQGLALVALCVMIAAP